MFAYGTCPAGPRRLDPVPEDALRAARFGDHELSRDDAVFADLDGVLFVPRARVGDVLAEAQSIRKRERRQAEAIRGGRSLRDQMRFMENEVPSLHCQEERNARTGKRENNKANIGFAEKLSRRSGSRGTLRLTGTGFPNNA